MSTALALILTISTAAAWIANVIAVIWVMVWEEDEGRGSYLFIILMFTTAVTASAFGGAYAILN